jgi:hypothetical protein
MAITKQEPDVTRGTLHHRIARISFSVDDELGTLGSRAHPGRVPALKARKSSSTPSLKMTPQLAKDASEE